MGDTKSRVSNAEIEPESSKNDEDNSQDANTSRAQSLRSVATMQKKRTTSISGSSSNTLFTENKDLLKVCKPISIRVKRLPESIVNKCAQLAEERVRKRKKCMWKSGYSYEEKRKKLSKQQKLQRQVAALLQTLQSGLDEKGKNDAEQPEKPEKIIAVEISNIPELATKEESSSETPELPTQLIAIEENEVDKSAECTENSEINIEVSTSSKLSESESKITAEVSESSLNKPEQISFPELSDNVEICLATNIPQDLSNAAIDTTEILSESNPVVPPEKNNNQNRKTSLQRHSKENNSIRIQFVETRKRTSQLHDETEETQSHISKKYKSSRSAELSEETDTIEGKDDSESIKNSDLIVKQFTVTKVSRADPKSVRRRSTTTEKSVLREVKVVLCRLEDSKDTLVLEWTRKNNSERSNDTILTESRTSSVKRLTAVEEPLENGRIVAGVPITSLEDLSGTLDISKRFNEPKEPEEPNTDQVLSETLDTNKILPEEPNTDQVLSETLDTSKNGPEEPNTDQVLSETLDTSKNGPEESNTDQVLSDALDTTKNGPEEPDTDVLSKIDAPAALEVETVVPIACGESGNNLEDEDDDEIVRFLGQHRRIRSSIDSSSSASSSGSQTFVPTRVLRSRTPKMNGSFLEKIATSSPTTKTPRLRIRERSTSTDSSNSEGINNHNEIPEILHQESTTTLLLRKRETTESTSDSSRSRQEPRRPPSSRRKACQVVSNDTSLNDGKRLSGFLVEEKTSVSASINDSSNHENVPNVNQNEAEIIEESNNSSDCRTNFVTCEENREDEVSPDALTEVNSDFSEIETATSSSCNEVLVARRKLTALKNAMVVLTRLEDLEGLSEDNKFTVNEMEFKTSEDFVFSRSFTPDPLEMNKNDNRHSLRETENSIVPSSTSAVRFSPRKTLRPNVAVNNTNRSIIQESPESEIEMHLGLEDACSQETIESDVEMTLVLEENSSPDGENSDAELLMSEDRNRTILATRNETESPDVVVLDVGKAAGSKDELINLPEGILTDANSNSGDTRNATILDEHCKHCPCKEHKNDKGRPNCQNIPATHKCATCRTIYKESSTLCNVGFLCNVCQATFLTHSEITRHRLTCVKKVSQKQNSVDESTNVEETAELENPPATNAGRSATKASEKRENYPKGLSRKMRAKSRGTIDNLKCGVCSTNFTTTQALSEHIFKHNTEELQEAYRTAKAKALEDSKTSKATSAKQKDKSSTDQMAPKIASVETVKDKSLPQELSTEPPQLIATNVSIANRDSAAKSATVCLCHRDKHPACPDKTDLQIEMVLLCQYCMVIFRRRECFEIHYRTSPQCATDRTRGRSPKLYCANCQSTLNSWAGMRRHLEVHASLNVEGTVRFVCNICRVVFVGFGALFYNHWSSHLKDTMFVASRYSFPKNSVQPIDGIPKLPIGASSEESYILVAEHVCSNCKKPFSTRRDLEMHEKSKTCVETDDAGTTEKQWHCDVCNQSFTSRRGLNKHCKAQHSQRFLCVATSPLTPAFMCTRCFAMRKLVSEIEYHWRSTSHHDMPLGFTENEARIEKVGTTGGAPDDANASKNENQVSKKSVDKSKTVEPLIDISESIEPEITCVFQSPTKTSQKQAGCVNHQESQLASTNSNTPCATPMLLNLLSPSPTMLDKELGTKTRALENPSVDIVLSEISKTNVSAQLVINQRQTNSADDRDDQTNKDCYKIVMTPKQSSGNVKVALGKTGPAKSSEKDATKTTVSGNKDINEASTTNTSAATIATANKPKLTNEAAILVESSPNCDVPAKTPDTADGKKNQTLSETAGSNKADSSISAWLNRPRVVPEIIDLSDEMEEVETSPATTPGKTSKPTRVITKNNAKTNASNKSGNSKSKKAAIKSKSPAKANSLNDSGASNSEVFPFVLDTAEKSFEEVRFADYTSSKLLASKESAAAKKPGFLRVKNLSELQAVKIHNCLNCNTVFETPTALEEHCRSQLCTSMQKPPEYPKGMTGALILPDNSKTTTTQPLPTVYATGNVVTQQLIGLDSGLGVISGVPVSSVIVNNETAGSWISVGGQHDTISSVALVNSTHSLSGGALLMKLGDQQSANNTINNPNTIMATSIATSTATIAQPQDFLAVQQQQQQQYQQQQLQQYQQQQQQQQYQQQPILTMNQQQPILGMNQQQPILAMNQQQPILAMNQQQPILGMNQQLSDNCNGQIGFHVMPAMVLPPTTQINKQQCTDNALRNTSIANLPLNGQINNAPFTYHSDRPNRYICSICSTFRCNNIGTMNTHVMKHYNGFNNPSTQNTTQSAAGGTSNVGFQGAKDKNSQNATLRGKGQDSNSIGNQMKDGVFLRNTPQGLVWVTSMSTQMTNQQPGSSAGQNNSQVNVGRSILRGGQIVYRCLICKSAMYKTYPPLRNHVVLVHGISDLISAGLDNIVQKIYLCTHCPHGAAMYDSEESHRQHVDTCHTNICPTCGRAFSTHHNLKMHLTTCSGAPRDPLNASDTNC